MTTTSAWTQLISLTQMRNTVRRMTARYTPQQMPDTQIDYYINTAYTLHFPEQFKNLKLTKPYIFLTTPNVDTYDFVYQQGLVNAPTPPNTNVIAGNIQLSPPVYCQGYILRYYQDKSTFFNRWPKLSVNQIINHGNATPGPYFGIIPPFPFLRSQMDVFGNVTNPAVIISAMVNIPYSPDSAFTFSCSDVPQVDSNVGKLYNTEGNDIGTVNYLTGFYKFTLANAAIIPADATIYGCVIPYQSSRPTDVLFYNQQIILRPVPQEIYQMEFQISQQPTQLIADNQAPELDEWYMLVCALASKLIYIDFPDPEGMNSLKPILDEQICMAQRRSLRQLGTQRAQTIFSAPGNRNGSSYYYGSEYSGGISG